MLARVPGCRFSILQRPCGRGAAHPPPNLAEGRDACRAHSAERAAPVPSACCARGVRLAVRRTRRLPCAQIAACHTKSQALAVHRTKRLPCACRAQDQILVSWPGQFVPQKRGQGGAGRGRARRRDRGGGGVYLFTSFALKSMAPGQHERNALIFLPHRRFSMAKAVCAPPSRVKTVVLSNDAGNTARARAHVLRCTSEIYHGIFRS